MKTIETKVWAAVAGSGIGAAVSAFLLWFLGVTVWGQSSAADKTVEAVSAVPAPVSGLIAVAITVTGTFLAGYAAPHTARPVDNVITPVATESAPTVPAIDGTITSGPIAKPDGYMGGT